MLALLICTALGIGLQIAGAEFPQKMQETFEGFVALIATGILASMVFWMAKAARSIKSQLHDSIDAAAGWTVYPDTIDPRQKDQTHTALVALKDVWKLDDHQELQ